MPSIFSCSNSNSVTAPKLPERFTRILLTKNGSSVKDSDTPFLAVPVYVNDTRHLEQLIDKLRSVEGVVKVSRFDSKE